MRVLPFLTVLLFAGPLQAATTCVFTQECLEGEECAETSYNAEISAAGGETLTLTTDAETLEGRKIASGDNLHYVFETPSAAHFMTNFADGAARYTIHMDGPFTITYHGTCEGAP